LAANQRYLVSQIQGYDTLRRTPATTNVCASPAVTLDTAAVPHGALAPARSLGLLLPGRRHDWGQWVWYNWKAFWENKCDVRSLKMWSSIFKHQIHLQNSLIFGYSRIFFTDILGDSRCWCLPTSSIDTDTWHPIKGLGKKVFLIRNIPHCFTLVTPKHEVSLCQPHTQPSFLPLGFKTGITTTPWPRVWLSPRPSWPKAFPPQLYSLPPAQIHHDGMSSNGRGGLFSRHLILKKKISSPWL
jgi:hypothetical protein